MAPIKYSGLVVTSIKCEYNGNEVTFDGDAKTGTEALFLKDVVETADKSNKFKATKITTAQAKEYIKTLGGIDNDTTPLFCVHGYNVEPQDMLSSMKDRLGAFVQGGEGPYYPIPVLWPSDSEERLGIDAQRSYEWDQETWSQQAGKVLFEFVKSIDDNTFKRKSLLMHSMGNHVVFNGACGFSEAPPVQFENIFMVAADIPFDVFHKEPDENYIFSNGDVYKNKRLKASNFYKMLAKKDGKIKGKVYFLHWLDDNALFWSSQLNWDNRVGQRGIGKYKWVWNQSWYEDKDLIRDEFRPIYENYDVGGFTSQMSDQDYKHSYQFDDFAIKYYASKALKE